LSFAINRDITVKQARVDNLQEIFHTPLSEDAFQQLHHLNESLADLPNNDQHDKWLCFGGSHPYSSQRAYRHMAGKAWTHPVYSWMWKTKCQPKQNIFFWLLLRNRLNTRSLRKRWGMSLDSYTCENCILQLEETMSHLFPRCNFALRCWLTIGITSLQTLHLLLAVL
jgi:hypothetical protein